MTTTDTSDRPVYHSLSLPPRNRLSPKAPLGWLGEGWRYFNRTRTVSIIYGAVFAAIGALITWLGLSEPQFILTFWSGFLLVGPLFAMGLYRIAQLADQGESLRMATCWRVLSGKVGGVALFIVLLTVIMIAWIRFSSVAAALYVGNVGASDFIRALGTADGIGFLAVLFGVGAVFAIAMFALTAWSLPMVLDGRADFITAIVVSVKATFEQPVPMLVWGALVAGLTIIGMLTFFIAFVVIFPLLGYATWAAYKELFGSA